MKPKDPSSESLTKLRARIAALQAKTVGNGCTEGEALAAAIKVAELLDRHDLSRDDLELRNEVCLRVPYASTRKKRMPIADCIDAVAHFFDCAVWREKDRTGDSHHVFFGLPPDAEAAHALMTLVEVALRTELGRFKATPDYLRLKHQDRHIANASFVLGMATSIAGKLLALKAERAEAAARTGRDLAVVKTSVEAELARLGLTFGQVSSAGRLVLPEVYAAGEVTGRAFKPSL